MADKKDRADRKSAAARLDALVERLEALETRVESAHGDDDGYGGDSAIQLCGVPPVERPTYGPDVSVDRAEAIWTIGRTWVNGTNLHYYLFDSGRFSGSAAEHDVVRQAFDDWQNLGIGLTFTEVDDIDDAELRIGFLRNDGSWSTVGRDALTVGQAERTMNFGWNITVSGPNGLDTALHEIGHALGFRHEHQNPNSGIVWDEDAVYDYFARSQTPPWSRAKTDHNILNKINPLTVDGSDWDPDSIMHYQLPAGLILVPQRYRTSPLIPAAGLSDSDIEQVRRLYPGGGEVVPEVRPWQSERLSIAAGEQKNFNVIPTASRDYDFRTFGQSDTVMVLFEEDGGDFRFVEGDDDSGSWRNAAFRVRLVKGRRYQLRIRLFYSFASGDTAVMMW